MEGYALMAFRSRYTIYCDNDPSACADAGGSLMEHKKKSFKKRARHFFRCLGRTLVRIGRRLGELLLEGLHALGLLIKKGLRLLVRKLSTLPTKTLIIGFGSACAALVLIIVLAAVIPGKSRKGDSAVGGDSIYPDGVYTSDNTLYTSEEIPEDIAEDPVTAPMAANDFVVYQKGSDGDAVATIQERLMELGYMDSDEPTTHFGPLTEEAVQAFQRHNELETDGILAEETYTLLFSDTAKAYVMQLGDKGEDVESVQTRLYELGYLTKKSDVDGSFGDGTSAAVLEFQKSNKLSADGKVGNKTLNTLFSDGPVSKFYSIGDSSDEIKAIQERLKKLGYFSGKCDGQFTKATAAAVRDFQGDNGLSVDGNVGPATKSLLLSANATDKVVKLGDSGADVIKVQNYLIKLKYMKSGANTGYYGEVTETAVKSFQKRNGLSQDGKVGTSTMKLLSSSKAKKAATAKPKATATPKPAKATPTPKPGKTASPTKTATPTVSPKLTGADKLIATAEKYLGIKYVSGGKKPSTGFDCSGFVYYCLNEAGIKQSYMTSIQWRSCSKYQKITSLSQIKKGDILVFSGSTMAKGHVGIAMSSSKMIDASSSNGKIRTTSVTSSYWKTHFLMAYRIY